MLVIMLKLALISSGIMLLGLLAWVLLCVALLMVTAALPLPKDMDGFLLLTFNF